MQRRFLIQLVIQNQVPWAQSKTRQQNGKGSVAAFTNTDREATIQLTVRQLCHASKCITHKITFSEQTNIVKRFSTLFFFYGEIIFRSCPKKKKKSALSLRQFKNKILYQLIHVSFKKKNFFSPPLV